MYNKNKILPLQDTVVVTQSRSNQSSYPVNAEFYFFPPFHGATVDLRNVLLKSEGSDGYNSGLHCLKPFLYSSIINRTHLTVLSQYCFGV